MPGYAISLCDEPGRPAASLHGLAQARRAQGDAAGADEAMARFRRAWPDADVRLAGS